jgi:hypothetical protein
MQTVLVQVGLGLKVILPYIFKMNYKEQGYGRNPGDRQKEDRKQRRKRCPEESCTTGKNRESVEHP